MDAVKRSAVTCRDSTRRFSGASPSGVCCTFDPGPRVFASRFGTTRAPLASTSIVSPWSRRRTKERRSASR